MTSRDVCIALAIALIAVSPAAAQDPPDPVAEAPMRIGVFGLAPRIVLTNLGVDTNVFNEVDDPKQDFTIDVAPTTDVWMRAGRGLFTFNVAVPLTYFQEYDTERSAGIAGSVRYDHRFNRLVPFVSYAGSNTRQRPGYEIDVRTRAINQTFRAGAALRVGSKTDVEAAIRRDDLEYDGDAVFAGRPLNQALNRTLEAFELTYRQRLTVLTTVVVRASASREEFEFSPDRDNDSVRASAGFELGRFALIRGNAFVGFRRITAREGGTIPEFTGVTADIGVAYSAPTRTRLELQVSRDLAYSFEVLEPYYVQTGVRGTLTQVVTGKFDLQIHGGRDRLAYRSSVASLDGRLDRIDRFGGGIGYQLNPEFRVGVNVESFYRNSEVPGRNYRGLRAGLVANYGF